MDKQKFIFNRRQFLKTSVGAAALLAARRRAYAFYQSPGLAKYVGPLRTYTSTDALTLAASDSPSYKLPGTTHYSISVGQYSDQLHRDLKPTKLFGYFQSHDSDGNPIGKHLGMAIVAQLNSPVQITFKNELPAKHIIPVDTSNFFYNAAGFVASGQIGIATHLHGGLVPWVSDGGAYDWFTKTVAGPSFKNNVTLVPGSNGIWGGLPAGCGEYYYPNNQSARLMWYHDHSHDITRINAYAGIASAYIMRDPFENGLTASGVLPSLGNAAEIPLVFQDKVFIDSDPESPNYILKAGKDPTWPILPVDHDANDLWYPHKYEGPPLAPEALPLGTATATGRWDSFLSPFVSGRPAPPPDPSDIPEMFGDTILVNGTVYPYLTVTPRRYRFRVLNACNARFMNLQLYEVGLNGDITLVANGEIDPNGNPVMVPTNTAGPAMYQIGTEAGFLPAPVVHNSPPRPIGYQTAPAPASTVNNVNRYSLLLAPAERADVIIDFGLSAGKTYVLYSDTPAPFPGGDLRNDYYFGMANLTQIGGSAGPSSALVGPNTRTLMQITVSTTGARDAVSTATWAGQIKTALASRSAQLVPPSQVGAIKRKISLNETCDANGRLIQMMGTDTAIYTSPADPTTGELAAPFFGRFEEDLATEVVNAGAIEIWEIYNNTADTHPIHFHLVNVQIVSRQPFEPASYPNPVFMGPARLPDANEKGWKETVRVNPGEVTRVIMKFDLPTGLPFKQPSSDRATLIGAGKLAAPPTGSIYHEYTYHCHILEHEEHDMMRPLVVIGPA